MMQDDPEINTTPDEQPEENDLAVPSAQCLYNGQYYDRGQEVCMTLPAGNRVIARCGRNGRWTLTGQAC
jgi:hypothetical protein